MYKRQILKRFAKRIVLSFDADAAGQAAAERFYEWEKTYDVDVRVAALPPYVDPADLAQSDPEALRLAVEEAQPFLAFRVDRALSGEALGTLEGRARAAEQATALVREHPNPLVRDQYLVLIADRCGIDIEQLRAMADSTQRRPVTPAPNPAAEHVIDLVNTVELQVLQVAVHQPELVPDIVTVDLFFDPHHREIFQALLEAGTLFDAIDNTAGSAQVILQGLMVDPPEDMDQQRAERLVGRRVDEAATRELTRLASVARTTDDPGVGRRVAELHHGLVRLRDHNWQIADTRGLLAWLSSVEQS